MNTDLNYPLQTVARMSPFIAFASLGRAARRWISSDAFQQTALFSMRSAALIMLCLVSPLRAAAGPWQWLSPTPTGNRISSFVYGGGQFVGVGGDGEIITSPDGTTWTTRESGTREGISRVVYDRGSFWAISGSDSLISNDGIVWTKHNAPGNLLDLAAGNNLLVAIGAPVSTDQPYRMLVSSDGINWTSNNIASLPQRLLFAHGVFVAVDTTGNALASTDGVTWTITPLPGITTTPFLVAGNGSFLVSFGERTYLSTNGTTWRDVTSHPPDPNGGKQTLTVPYLESSVGGSTIGFAGGYFYLQQSRYAQRSYLYYRSSDGETWERATGFQNADLSTLAEGGGVTVGTELYRLYASVNPGNYAIHFSTDGINWTMQSKYADNSDLTLVYGLGRFFLGSTVSSDALTWVPNPFEPTHAAGDLVFRITSQFAGSSFVSTTIDPRAVTSVVASADGLTGLTVDVKIATPRAVAFGNGRYVFVGDGGSVSNSTDGLTWTAGASGTASDLRAVLFAFNRFVAIGSKGGLLTSQDGLTWTVEKTATTIDFLSIAAGPDRIVIGTPGSTVTVPPFTLSGNVIVEIATSRRSDALLWFDGEFTSIEQYAINYATGSTSFGKSVDGSTWTDLPLHFPSAIGGRALVAVGNGAALSALPAGVSDTLQKLFTAVLQQRSSAVSSPVIVHAPAAVTIPRGETALFSVGATGSGALAYQWNHNGTPIPGATSQVLSLPLSTDSDAGDYTVTVTNSLGSATSAAARLTVETPVPLVITKQPAGGALYEFQPFTLTVEVTGSGPVTYQWRRNGTAVWNATSSNLQLYAASYSMDDYTGTYDVVITAPYSTVTSEAVVVTRGGPSATVSQSGNAVAGGTLVITATTTGKSPFAYDWSRAGGSRWAGANGATVVLPNLTSADNGPYAVTVTDADGLSTQVFFIVIVSGSDPAPTTAQVTAIAGQILTLRAPISVADTSNPSFQWRFKNVPITGATEWSYTTSVISDTTVGDYSVVITNATGGTAIYTTTVVLGSAATAPTFVAQTTGRTLAVGGATTFSVSAGSASVSSYQWQVSTDSGSTWANLANDAPYSGVTSNTLAIASVTAVMNGYQYHCLASNAAGNATSNAAILSISNDPLLIYPVAIARSSSGDLFVADVSANVIRRVTPAGATSIFAGTAGNAGSLDGTGSTARFNQPNGLAFDTAGNLFVADTGNATIRKITATGAVTTLAGDPASRGNVDATGNAARFNHPVGLAVDGTGNIYVADTFTHTVRKITSGGIVTTLAGTNAVSGSTDGSGAAARFSGPAGVAVDTNGTVYIADTGNNTIRKLTASGAVTTLAGLPGVGGSNDGTESGALFSQPTNLTVDASGSLFVADTGNALIRRITPSGVVTLLAGVPGIAGLSDGMGLDALLDQPHGMTIDGTGTLFVADTGNAALRKISGDGTVTTLALVAATPPPVTNPPTTPSGSSGNGGTTSPSASGGGGGAMNPWLLGSLALLYLVRRRRSTH